MAKEDMLADAKKRYPIGVTFISAFDKGNICIVKNHEAINTNGIDIYYHGTCLFWEGKWAEVISRPEPQVINNYEIY